MMDLLKEVTREFRYKIVKIISPKIYERFIMTQHNERPILEFMEKRFQKNSIIGVEIGVFKGENAEKILETLNIKNFFLVDPYIEYIDGNEELCSGAACSYSKKIAIKRLKNFSNIEWVFITSDKAVNNIPDSLDFVYIDANHNYEFVKNDIELYYPKVRIGGVLGGHDFSGDYLGVVQAVIEFTKSKNLELFTKNNEWWIVKD